MPSKYRIILEMASQTARDIASNADRYTDFLITAANNYKYSFKEQLLIHAQKPDATACAEIDTWNKLGRWVNKGTKGIALLIDRDVPYKLRHVFDISDTNSRAGRNITLWQMKPEYEYAVSESLQASFGDVEEPRDFPHLLIDISGYAVEDNLSDYLMELNAVKAGSFLEELDDTSLEAWLKTTLKSSVAFMALSRAGYEPRQYFDREDFSHLFDFNTVEVISVLGAAVSDISEMVIREMGKTVKEMEKEERRKIRTFAQEGASAYHKNRTENKERSNEHGTDLYDAGGLSDSRSDRAGEPEAWEVWNAAADIPPRAPGWDLHRDAAERNTEQSSGGGGPAGTEDAGRPDRADEGAERSDGAAEGRGSDVVGADDELHSPLGGGSDSERPDLRVTLPTVEQQQEIIAEAEEEKSSAFAISQEDIDAILTRGSGIHVIIIGIDSGYGNIKTANCCFPASVSVYDKEPVFKENLLVFESKFYLIGEGHKEFLADKTRDLDYYVLALAAIARELNIRKMTCGKIRIAAGLPLTWVSGQRDEFRDYLLQNKAVDFSFRNVSYHVEIVGVDVFPQGFAAVADRLSDFRGVNMICDIGNGTMNIMFINDKKPVSGNMFTEKYGTHQCLLAVRENVMRAHHTTVDEAIINRVFRFGTADIKEDYLKTITDTATDYVEGIFQRLREHEYNPELMRLYVLGGGSCLIRNFGVYDASRVTINDDICATAKGYEYLAELNARKGISR